MKKATLKEWLDRYTEKIYPFSQAFTKILKSGKKLKIYVGMDPSRPDLHIGHTISLWLLRKLQDLGHEIIFLVGDFTAMIGDPTNKSAARKPMTHKEVLANCSSYKNQVKKIISFSGKNKAELKFNYDWLAKLTLEEVIELAANFSVQQMIERDMFQERIKKNKSISLHELLYPLMQGYDSFKIGVDVEIGGTDQTFNMLTGRTLMRKLRNKEKFVITVPLLIGLDGKEKMSKSLDNYIGIIEPAKDQFGKVMSIPDKLIYQYFKLATQISNKELTKIKKELSKSNNPKNLKVRLAKEIVKLYHSEEEANNAEAEFNRVFVNREVPFDIPEAKLNKSVCESLASFLVDVKLALSKTEARRLITQGGVKIDGAKITEDKENLCLHDGMVVQVGKRRFVRIKIK